MKTVTKAQKILTAVAESLTDLKYHKITKVKKCFDCGYLFDLKPTDKEHLRIEVSDDFALTTHIPVFRIVLQHPTNNWCPIYNIWISEENRADEDIINYIIKSVKSYLEKDKSIFDDKLILDKQINKLINRLDKIYLQSGCNLTNLSKDELKDYKELEAKLNDLRNSLLKSMQIYY